MYLYIRLVECRVSILGSAVMIWGSIPDDSLAGIGSPWESHRCTCIARRRFLRGWNLAVLARCEAAIKLLQGNI